VTVYCGNDPRNCQGCNVREDCAPPPVTLIRLPLHDPSRDFEPCEGCGALLSAEYCYGIGGGWAYACPACALKSIGDGSAVLSGGAK